MQLGPPRCRAARAVSTSQCRRRRSRRRARPSSRRSVPSRRRSARVADGGTAHGGRRRSEDEQEPPPAPPTATGEGRRGDAPTLPRWPTELTYSSPKTGSSQSERAGRSAPDHECERGARAPADLRGERGQAKASVRGRARGQARSGELESEARRLTHEVRTLAPRRVRLRATPRARPGDGARQARAGRAPPAAYGVAAIRSGMRCSTSGVPSPVTASQPVEAQYPGIDDV